jgi:transposase
MVKQYRPWLPAQDYLLPPSPRDWLPANHLVFFLLDLMATLDLREVERAIHAKDARGTRPYDPRLMTALLLYGYCVGLASSRKLEQATYTDVACRVLAGECHPDHTVIASFRRSHLHALQRLFVQILRLCQRAGLVTLGHVALDGTKVQANASKHKAMSYARMLKTEAQLEVEMAQLLATAERVDQAEDARYGKGRRGDELPDELARRDSRLRKIREAKAALEAEAAAARAREVESQAERAGQQATDDDAAAHRAARAAERAAAARATARHKAEERVRQARAAAQAARAHAKTRADRRRARAAEQELQRAERELERAQHAAPPDGAQQGAATAPAMPEHQVPAEPDGTPKPEAQRNFTDPESRIMKRGSEYLQGYNCQAAVDEAHQIIVACDVSNQAPDPQHLAPMLDEIGANCGAMPTRLTADNGYYTDANVGYCAAHGVDPYLSVGRQPHGGADGTPPPAESDCKRAMRAKLQTTAGHATYARRKAVVEPSFGQIKEARGFRRLLLRGTAAVRAEWALICSGHNLLKLFGAVWQHARRSPPAVCPA